MFLCMIFVSFLFVCCCFFVVGGDPFVLWDFVLLWIVVSVSLRLSLTVFIIKIKLDCVP